MPRSAGDRVPHYRTGHLRRTVAAAGAVLVLLGGTALPATAGPLEKDRLREALLDATDFPPGWASDSESSAEKRGTGVPRPQESLCQELFDGSGTTERAGFARTPGGPFITTAVAAHQDTQAADDALSEFTETAERCQTFQTQGGAGGGQGAITYEAGDDLDMARLGEDSHAIRFSRQGDAGGGSVVTDLVIARVGAQTVRVALAGPNGTDADNVRTVAKRAVQRLQEVSEGRTPAPLPDQPDTTQL